MKQNKLMWGLTAVAAALGFMFTVQMTSRPTYSSQPTSYIDLRTQVEEQAQEHAILESDISKVNAQLDEYKAAQGSGSSLQQVLEKDEHSVEEQAGILSVNGPGLTVTIQDDPAIAITQFEGEFQQQTDEWVSEVVNTLFGNGATAISINGQRLVTTSSIRLVSGLAGVQGIHVNDNPVTMPYVITAVGNIQDMTAALTLQQLKAYMGEMGEDFIVTPQPGANGVHVPGYQGSLPGQWAKEGSGS
jgi:uncharacterized protein YlxW (UPF0749 family)